MSTDKRTGRLASLPSRTRGLTLMELIIVIALIGIAAGIAVPSYQRIIAGHRAKATTNELIAGLRFARMAAIKRGMPVTLCPLAGTEEAPECLKNAANADWAVGWMVFVESDAAGEQGHFDVGEILLLINRSDTKGVVRPLADKNGEALASVSYAASTLHNLGEQGAAPGALRVCDVNSIASPRVVYIMPGGWSQRLGDEDGDKQVSGVPGLAKAVACNE